jgi:hypothetical protein
MLPDSRLRFPAPLLDFSTEVGLSGQDNERFPAADVQPRWDWLLIWFISLLSNQASYEEPTQYRDGTIWFDMNSLTFKVWRSSLENISGSWMKLSSSIEMETVSGVPLTLSTWYTSTNSKLSGAAPQTTFSGNCITDGATDIPIPVTLQGEVDLVKTRPIIYINGLLIDPRNCSYNTAAIITLSGGTTLQVGDRFTIIISNILPANFYIPDVVV